MIDRALLQQALEALEESIDLVRHEYKTDWRHGMPTRKAQLDGMKKGVEFHEKAITALRERLAQPEQQPIAWMDRDGDLYKMPEIKGWALPHTMLYATPTHHQWQGLTKPEFEQAVEGLEDLEDCWIAIEAKLREKNT